MQDLEKNYKRQLCCNFQRNFVKRSEKICPEYFESEARLTSKDTYVLLNTKIVAYLPSVIFLNTFQGKLMI